MFSVTITGIPEAMLKLDLFEKLLIKELIEATDWSTITVRDFAKHNHPYHDWTQNLTNSIYMQPAKIEGNFIAGKVGAGMEYAAAVEFRTERSRPYPFLVPAIKQNETRIKQALEGTVKRCTEAVKALGVV